MRRFVLIVGAAAVAVAALAGCVLLDPVRGSGIVVTTPYAFAACSKIAAGSGCSVHVVPDAVTSLQVTCDDNLVPYLLVEQTAAGSVSIGLKPGHWYLDCTFAAEVHTPTLAALDLSGGSTAHVPAGFSSPMPMTVTLSGGSRATFDSIGCGALTADVSGGSDLTANGSADGEQVLASGGSFVHLFGLESPQASVNLSGGSQSWVDVGGGPLNLMASGGSTLYYRGAPDFDIVDLSGGSRLVSVP
jgi:hypothetical protein